MRADPASETIVIGPLRRPWLVRLTIVGALLFAGCGGAEPRPGAPGQAPPPSSAVPSPTALADAPTAAAAPSAAPSDSASPAAPATASAAPTAPPTASAAPAAPATAPAPADSTSRPAPAPPDKGLALELFRAGRALAQRGDYDGALEYFLKSISAYPTMYSTRNAAICLVKLKRLDEALEMYSTLYTDFVKDIGAQELMDDSPTIAWLKRQVGWLRVSADVEGSLVIDGRPRGRLPIEKEIVLLPGEHRLRIFKDGYKAFETTFLIAAGQHLPQDARLERLEVSGALRVEDPGNEGSEVLIDGALVGTSPWEGTLAPGRHTVWTRLGDRGSAPTSTMVIRGQTTLLRALSSALGPVVRVDAEPASAEIAMDGVRVGQGTWQGRLPEGWHSAAVFEEGYRTGDWTFRVSAGDVTPLRRRLSLQADLEHPRWPRIGLGGPWLGAFGGALLGTTLAGAAERDCERTDTCSRTSPPVSGFLLGLRAAYGFRAGLSLEVSGGVGALSSHFSRIQSERYGSRRQHSVSYFVEHDVRVKGPFIAAGLSYRAELFPRLTFLGRLEAGAMFADARDLAEASAGGLKLSVLGRDEVLRPNMPFIAPELGLAVKWGPATVGAALGMLFFPLTGASFNAREIGNPDPSTCGPGADPGSAACAPNARTVAGAAFGPFSLWAPQLFLQYDL